MHQHLYSTTEDAQVIQFKVQDVNGKVHDVTADEGETLLAAAMNADIEGFVAECGGCCVCATCHCYVEEADLAKLTQPAADELQMLEFTATERLPTSRLACQIKLTSQHHGMKFNMPERQY
jgi:ferredoxin, 2Fe-2S